MGRDPLKTESGQTSRTGSWNWLICSNPALNNILSSGTFPNHLYKTLFSKWLKYLFDTSQSEISIVHKCNVCAFLVSWILFELANIRCKQFYDHYMIWFLIIYARTNDYCRKVSLMVAVVVLKYFVRILKPRNIAFWTNVCKSSLRRI